MHRSTILILSLLAIALAGCNRAPGPSEVRTAAPAAAATLTRELSRIERIDAALSAAGKYLAERQAADGSWPSEVYGTFKSGDALTGLVLTTLIELESAPGGAPDRDCIDRATQYLVAMVGDDGRVHPPEQALAYPVYTAAGAVIALSRIDEAALRPARDAWLAFLRERQLAEPLSWQPADHEYGGWGYAHELPRKPAASVPVGNLAEPNLSATVFALAALRAAGVKSDDPAVQTALVFVRRCQNFADEGADRDAKFDDGGFYFIHDDPVRNKAGVAGTDHTGRTRFASYGSATADGLRALQLCGLSDDDPRVAAAWSWLDRHFDADSHPGDYALDRQAARPAVYFYYCYSFLEAVAAANSPGPAPANTTRWAAAIADALLARQRPDASWKNDAVDVREDDPLIATALAASTLVRCRQLLLTRADTGGTASHR
jgi:squalene-hopene/tetraprenyl-beta-curcumene cyclase